MEVENETDEEAFYYPVVPSSLQHVASYIDYARQFIFPVIHHEANRFRNLNIEAISTGLSAELNWAFRLGASSQTSIVRGTTLSM